VEAKESCILMCYKYLTLWPEAEGRTELRKSLAASPQLA